MKALILMTRIPIPGKTKTRLMNIFTGIECAEINKAFLLDLFDLFNYLKDDMDIYLTYTPEDSFDIMKNMVPDYIKTFPQKGEDLGKKMANAIGEVLNRGYNSVVLIGSDIPSIQLEDIYRAFDLLEDQDICLGPTFDGGYYLVGMKKLYSNLFYNDLEWGKKSVLERTCDIANKAGLSVGLAPKHMDIDTKEDLIRFIEEASIPQNTFNKIKEYLQIDFMDDLLKDYIK